MPGSRLGKSRLSLTKRRRWTRTKRRFFGCLHGRRETARSSGARQWPCSIPSRWAEPPASSRGLVAMARVLSLAPSPVWLRWQVEKAWLGQLVGRVIDTGSPARVGTPKPRPLVRVVAVLVHVPIGAAGVPDAAGEGRAQLAVEGFGPLAPDLDPARVRAL